MRSASDSAHQLAIDNTAQKYNATVLRFEPYPLLLRCTTGTRDAFCRAHLRPREKTRYSELFPRLGEFILDSLLPSYCVIRHQYHHTANECYEDAPKIKAGHAVSA